MDELDRQILMLLQKDGRVSNAALARTVGLVPSAVLERVRKLEARGVIKGYRAVLDEVQIGLPLLAFIHVKTKDGCWSDDTSNKLKEIPYVLEVHSITGDDCYLVKLRARDTSHLNDMLRDYLKPIETIVSTHTTIVLERTKESTVLPVEGTDD